MVWGWLCAYHPLPEVGSGVMRDHAASSPAGADTLHVRWASSAECRLCGVRARRRLMVRAIVRSGLAPAAFPQQGLASVGRRRPRMHCIGGGGPPPRCPSKF